ncbi:MAG: hypothetical protein JNJ71_03485 [Rubrivivax sp.]|nr:hypothetical protein [Rubrivivax sp.]
MTASWRAFSSASAAAVALVALPVLAQQASAQPVIAPPVVAQQAPASPSQALGATGLSGEWNNHEQVWQQRLDLADPKLSSKPVPVAHRHWTVAPLPAQAAPAGMAAGTPPPAAPATSWLYLQRSRGDDQEQVDGQWLLRLPAGATPGNELRIEVLRLAQPERWINAHRQPQQAAALREAEGQQAPVCVIRLLPAEGGTRLDGAPTDPASCPDAPALGLPWRLGAGLWQQGEAGAELRARRARHFDGWVWFRNAGPGAAPDDKDTSFTARIQLHSEGQRLPLRRKDGSLSPWQLELAQLTYQNTRQPILKFALLDAATGKSIAYTWVNVEATRVGINLGWFQSGLTIKP